MTAVTRLMALAALLLSPACASQRASSPEPAAARCDASLAPAPSHPGTAATLAARRAALAGRIGTGVAVISGTAPGDREGPARPSSDFAWLTGLEVPDARLVFEARDGTPRATVLYLPPDPAAPRGEAPASATSGIADVRCLPEAEGEVAAGPLLATLRPAKDAEEIRRLRRAAALSAEGAAAAMKAVRHGMREDSLQAVVERTFAAGGAPRTSFPSIIASGANALELHYSRNDSTVQEGDLVLVDVGAEFAGYAGDVTRTFPVSGRFTARRRDLYELVLETQRAAIAAVRPGVTIQDLDRIARERMAAASGDLCGEGGCVPFFIHGLSHHLGLDVHDPAPRDLPLAPGMVITIEPGLYLPDEGIGIRIEDDVLVTGSGHEVLTGAAPKDPGEVEARVRGG